MRAQEALAGGVRRSPFGDTTCAAASPCSGSLHPDSSTVVTRSAHRSARYTKRGHGGVISRSATPPVGLWKSCQLILTYPPSRRRRGGSACGYERRRGRPGGVNHSSHPGGLSSPRRRGYDGQDANALHHRGRQRGAYNTLRRIPPHTPLPG